MFIILLKLVTGFIGGILYIKFFPVSIPMGISDMIVIFVLEPAGFVLGMTFFLISFIANAEIIRMIIEWAAGVFKNFKSLKESNALFGTVLILLLMGCFFTLLVLSPWEAFALFCFSAIYGIISLDFKKINFAGD
ncbi:hypothetical protein ACOSZF_02760 [Cytobacillus firmus]|uniref:hypothetical protein n=1 Tax=Cytobacillus firmus TaxID=1399 RepID=UPI00077C5004|nr:hypothetical protein [Cytobacillus firmus]MBG9544547.1 hypothetical protein [Cytobacillus firmus]MBG9546344.1 hypothetical protein [Cytobacillus firmus]MBG9551976.1 hypothetical protein [Cytobacillus firmus]MBG9559319.1 hypothetical protein [Cytobacillus firmus]MBG9573494.1 hypothetical protein [Cytobacillus firmus]